ncbi:3959_t:CDS:2 [Entrophospora sp. SA101]|nr:3959_t:CDS:2 [Entrophospora sp. SA101]
MSLINNDNFIPEDSSNDDTQNERTPLVHQQANFQESEDTQDYRTLIELGKSTAKQTIFNTNILMGIAILALPLAFKYSGWALGLMIFLFCLIQTKYTAKTLKKCLDNDPRCITYSDLANLAYGIRGKYFIVALLILVGDSLKILFPSADLTTLKIIATLFIIPFTWIPIHFLSYTSMFGIFTTASLASVIILDGLTKPTSPGSLLNPMKTHIIPPNLNYLPLSFGLINSGFTGHAVFPSLYRDMEKPNEYNKIINVSYLITSVIYITVAASGYAMFGKETMPEITQNIMLTKGYNDFFNSLVIWFIVINPLSKYPLTITPINLNIELFIFKISFINRWFKHGITKKILIILCRTSLSLLILGIAIIFPKFERAMVAIFPLLCHLKMFGGAFSKQELVWNIFLLTTSIIMATLGTIWTFLPTCWLGEIL